MKELRLQGYRVEKTEQRLPIPGKFVTRDLFDCIDAVAIKLGSRITALQITSDSGGNMTARMKKAVDVARLWVSCGGEFQVWACSHRGWRIATMLQSGEWVVEKP